MRFDCAEKRLAQELQISWDNQLLDVSWFAGLGDPFSIAVRIALLYEILYGL